MMDAGTIYDQAHSFEADVTEQLQHMRVSAARTDLIGRLFASIYTNISHVRSAQATPSGLPDEATRHLIRIAFILGRLAEIFSGLRREGWVDRAIALTRVVENVVTGSDRPI